MASGFCDERKGRLVTEGLAGSADGVEEAGGGGTVVQAASKAEMQPARASLIR